MGCDYSLVDHHTFTVGNVIVNNTPDQTGELMEEQHKKSVYPARQHGLEDL